MCYFIVLMSSLLFYNSKIEKFFLNSKTNSKIVKIVKYKEKLSRCVQTFDWYCIWRQFNAKMMGLNTWTKNIINVS